MMLSQLSPSADHPHTDPRGKVKGDVGEWVAPGLSRRRRGAWLELGIYMGGRRDRYGENKVDEIGGDMARPCNV